MDGVRQMRDENLLSKLAGRNRLIVVVDDFKNGPVGVDVRTAMRWAAVCQQ